MMMMMGWVQPRALWFNNLKRRDNLGKLGVSGEKQ
jgi:hypothetical protein